MRGESVQIRLSLGGAGCTGHSGQIGMRSRKGRGGRVCGQVIRCGRHECPAWPALARPSGRRGRVEKGLFAFFLGLSLLLLPPAEAAPAEASNGPAVDYRVRVEGAGELEELLLEVSEANQLVSRPPPSVTSLRRRAREDLSGLRKALRSRGYYAAEVTVALDPEVSPASVLFQVDLGPQYKIGATHILVDPEDSAFAAPEPSAIGLVAGKPALARTVLDAESRLTEQAKRKGFALAAAQPRRVVVDHASATMDIELRIRSGPLARLAEPSFSGGEGVDPEFLNARIPWKRGDLYHPELLEKARVEFIDTNLFSTVRMRAGGELDGDGLLPVAVELVERKHRTVKLTLSYGTDIGPGVRAGWWHRNFFGAGERVAAEMSLARVESELKGSYRKPDFFRVDQALVSQLSITREDTDAYFSNAATASLGVERQLRPKMDLSVGAAFRYSSVEPADGGSTDQFGLLSLPVNYSWDFSDDRLDPTRGGRLSLLGAPYQDVLGSGLRFGKLVARYSHYYMVRESPRLILAGRTAVGSLLGASRDDIPADERFYAGGGGSLRGFGYQLASPLDEERNPIGGNSLLELSAEVRWKFTDTLGIVGFVDAGGAFESGYPDSSDDLHVGYGGGLRYHTPIGPLRLDVGFPLDPRDGVDDRFQIYISIGQAF